MKSAWRTSLFLMLVLKITVAHAESPAAVELVVTGPGSLHRIAVHLDHGDATLTQKWEMAFRRLFEFHDRDNDQKLSREEAARLPTPAALRQSAWDPFSLRTRRVAPPGSWDRDSNGELTLDEVQQGYRASGLGNVFVTQGVAQHTASLTAALLRAIDANRDGTSSLSEWKEAESVLLALDANRDGLLGPGELVDRCVYPGATGTGLWGPSQGALLKHGNEAVYVLLPPMSRQSPPLTKWDSLAKPWADAVDSNQDHQISSDEWTTWHQQPATNTWSVSLLEKAENSTSPSPNSTQTLHVGSLNIRLEQRDGILPPLLATGRKRLETRFKEHDSDSDAVAEFMARGTYESELLPFRDADRDQDERLTHAEFSSWLAMQEALAQAQVVMSTIDFGAGLFEFLDQNHDGSLARRELREAAQRLQAIHAFEGEQFQSSQLPRQLLVLVSAGPPQAVLKPTTPAGPHWFIAMDRNQDGEVTHDEFTGEATNFVSLDLNKNGVIDAAEAKQAR